MGLRPMALLTMVYGTVLTVPFLVSCSFPVKDCLLLWMPYDGACGSTMLAAYASIVTPVGVDPPPAEPFECVLPYSCTLRDTAFTS